MHKTLYSTMGHVLSDVVDLSGEVERAIWCGDSSGNGEGVVGEEGLNDARKSSERTFLLR